MAEKKQVQKQGKPRSGKSGRTVDKWKKKQWFNIIAPSEFDKKLLGETVAEKPKNVAGRIVKVDLGQLTGQRQKRHIGVLFKVEKVEGNNANCITLGHKISQGFINRLVRRRMSKVEVVQKVETSDGKTIRVKTISLSARKLSKKQKKNVGKKMREVVEKSIEKKPFAQVSQEIIFGVVASKLFKQLTKIVPIRRVEIVESGLLEGK